MRTFKIRMGVRFVLCSIVLWEALTAPFAGALVAAACGCAFGWACEKFLDWRSAWDARLDEEDRLRAKASAARAAEAALRARIEAEWAREKQAQREEPKRPSA